MDGVAEVFEPTAEDRRAAARTAIQPGQIWLIEQRAARGLVTLDEGALAGADVVLYESPLTPLLPRSRYAEPLVSDADGLAALSPRALKLAAEGWRVVQLVEPCPKRRRRLRDNAAALLSASGNAAALLSASGNARLLVRVFAKTATDCRRREALLPQLPELIDAVDADDLLTLVLGPLAGDAPVAAYACFGNGLAG